ncbi:hypothetical protein LAT59_04100 [Candidatus Gracilibacteria bacterium]|nr:hypothetical protein [Candidatus Gracilibacteria bacterium]
MQSYTELEQKILDFLSGYRDSQELDKQDIELRSAELPEFSLSYSANRDSQCQGRYRYELVLESGDCSSFMNTRSFEISQGHSFLRIEKGER